MFHFPLAKSSIIGRNQLLMKALPFSGINESGMWPAISIDCIKERTRVSNKQKTADLNEIAAQAMLNYPTFMKACYILSRVDQVVHVRSNIIRSVKMALLNRYQIGEYFLLPSITKR
ncbi:hypothetical protein Ancab_003825 [Ancistrocladus abbreviatus]